MYLIKPENVKKKLTVQKSCEYAWWQDRRKIDFILPETDISRTFIVIGKLRNTSIKYPRKSGLPSKEPLK